MADAISADITDTMSGRSSLVDRVKQALGTESLTTIGGGGGCINSGTAYRTKEGREVYVKTNPKSDALKMFVGEEASLKAIAATNTVLCPQPIKVLEDLPGGGSALLMQYLNMSSLRSQEELGKGLARLHRHNLLLMEAGDDAAVTQFGFPVPTSCGFLPQRNEWRDDWVEFFCEKIDHQMSMLDPPDAKAMSMWSSVRPNVRMLFEGIVVRPSLLHGDLWAGNSGETASGPVVLDAASFYGHHEYDLAITAMFGGFGLAFYNSYHSVIPKEKGFDKRHTLYKLFHNFNHWTHFGGGYRQSTLGILEELVKWTR